MATNPPISKTTDDLLVECEVATAIIGQYFACFAKELAEEKENEDPNWDKIDALETQLKELKLERMNVGTDNPSVIRKALYVYAPYLKNRMAM